MKRQVTIIYLLAVSSCATIPTDNSWCTFSDDGAEYLEFIPSTELIEELSQTGNMRIHHQIKNQARSLVWKKKNEMEVLVCEPGSDFGSPLCGSFANHFQNKSGVWEQDKSEFTNCHKVP